MTNSNKKHALRKLTILGKTVPALTLSLFYCLRRVLLTSFQTSAVFAHCLIYIQFSTFSKDILPSHSPIHPSGLRPTGFMPKSPVLNLTPNQRLGVGVKNYLLPQGSRHMLKTSLLDTQVLSTGQQKLRYS